MSFNTLPDEMKLKIFSYSRNWKDLSLVCRLWKDLIEQFQVFDICLLFTGKRSKEDMEIAMSSRRRFKSIKVKFSESNNLSLDDISKFMENNSAIENAELELGNNFCDEINFVKLLQLFKDVKSLKIILNYGLKIEDSSTNSALPCNNLKNLEVYFRDETVEKINKGLNLIECPLIERFIYKSKESRFGDMKFSLKFINKYTLMKLKYFDIACNVYQYWLEFLWTGSVLKIAECQDRIVENQFSEFVKNNCHHFPDLRQLFIYRSDIQDTITDLLFSNALNLETISTDWGLPVDGSNHKTYNNLKVLKLWGLKRPDKIYQLSCCFPNVQKIFICESIEKQDADLIQNSFKCLTDFQSKMAWNEYHYKFPPNETEFGF